MKAKQQDDQRGSHHDWHKPSRWSGCQRHGSHNQIQHASACTHISLIDDHPHCSLKRLPVFILHLDHNLSTCVMLPCTTVLSSICVLRCGLQIREDRHCYQLIINQCRLAIQYLPMTLNPLSSSTIMDRTPRTSDGLRPALTPCVASGWQVLISLPVWILLHLRGLNGVNCWSMSPNDPDAVVYRW